MSPIDFPAAPAPPPSEREALPLGRIVLVGLATLAIFAAGVAWVRWYQIHRRQALGGGRAIPAALGAARAGLVNQRVFPLEQSAQTQRALEEHRLSTYGWVDRDRRLIHVPIERAMEWTAQGGHP